MARRLILDTGVLVATERERVRLEAVIEEDDDVVVAAITVAELRTGVELADEPHRTHRGRFLARLLDTIPVEQYDLTTAGVHGRLLAHVHRAGSQRGAHDLLVAATAVATSRAIVTTDRGARFDELPEVEVVLLTQPGAG